MKVFWSWQSDLPGKISRYLIRDALDAAIQELNSDLAVEEPNRDGEVTLDQDRKGTVGSPTLAEVIFGKIRASDVFVADVTPVGLTLAEPAKKLINSNVAIELGSNDPSRYFNESEPIVQINGNSRQPAATLTVQKGALLYLRLSPTKQRPLLSFPDAHDFVKSGQLRPFTDDWSSTGTAANAFGAIAHGDVREESFFRATQLFRNGELWGFDAYLPNPTFKPNAGSRGVWAREMETGFGESFT